jgi:hypothetical protein
MHETGGIHVDPSFKSMVLSMIQDMKNNINAHTTEKEFLPQTKTNSNSDTIATNQVNSATGDTNSNNSNSFANNSNTIPSSANMSSNADTKGSGSTRRNILGKLDAAAASITAAVDFDKAIPKWTWKNR